MISVLSVCCCALLNDFESFIHGHFLSFLFFYFILYFCFYFVTDCDWLSLCDSEINERGLLIRPLSLTFSRMRNGLACEICRK